VDIKKTQENNMRIFLSLRRDFSCRLRKIPLWLAVAIISAAGVLFAALPQLTVHVPDFTMYEGQTQNITIKAVDPDGDSLSYSLEQAPAGFTLTDSILSWTPGFDQAGVDTVIYHVIEHPSLAYVADTFVVTVLDVGIAGLFAERTQTTALGDLGVTNALAWADYDNDGITDVFVANAGRSGRLYRGSSGAFSVESGFPEESGTADAASAAWADYDHDGRIDLYVVSSGLLGGSQNRLYHNDTTGIFTDVTGNSSTGNTGFGLCGQWVDFDCDGDPDIYVVNYGEPNELYSNNGNGTFTEMGDTTGLNDSGDGTAAAWCDYNGDGYPDLYLVNENSGNILFKNDGDSTFTDVTTTAGVGHTGSGSAAAWGDFDNDGDFDLFLANKDSVHVLFRNLGDGTFGRVGESSGLSVRGAARSAAWLDFDLDGNLDLIVTFSDSANKLYQNMGDTTFVNVAAPIGIDSLGYWNAATWADPTNQGAPDIYLGRRNGRNLYFDNNVNESWLKVKLHGVVSNRFGIGAKVRVKADGKAYVRWIDGGTGSMSEPAALFGLADASVVDSLTVFWPCGLRRDTTGVEIDNVLTWYETDSIFPQIDSTTLYPDTTFLDGPYEIYSKITDNNFSSAVLRYSTDRGQTYTAVSMTAQGGDFYLGNIPGQDSGTRVYYYVSALDSVGHITKDPYFAPDSFYMFSVDDSVPDIDSLTALPDTDNQTGPYAVYARASDNDSLRNVYLVWSIYRQGMLSEKDSVAMDLVGADTLGYDFSAELAGRSIGTQINYYANAVDLAGNFTVYPGAGVDSSRSFRVADFSRRTLVDTSYAAMGIGVSVADYNLDGWPDIFLANSDKKDYLLKGTDSLFTDVSTATVGTTVHTTTGGYWGDYNNDRYPDLYIVALGANVLLSNDRDGTFTDITETAGLGDEGEGWGCAWVDYDNDGLLDLFVVNKDGSDRLYHNQGDSTFVDQASEAGLSGSAGGVACAWADYDRDGYQDVYVVYYEATNKLYRNLGDSTFTEVTSTAGVAGGLTSASASWFDYNNDGFPDLYLVEQPEDILYRANSDGTFTQIELSSDGLSIQPGGFGAAWGDFNNDGFPDLIKSRGETGKKDRNAVLRGKAGGSFDNYTFESGITDFGEYRGVAWLDYDRDGKLDVVLNSRAGLARLYRNIISSTDNHYLRVSLQGTASNVSGLGAGATAFFEGNIACRQLGSGTGFTGASEPVLHFGLGSATTVDSLVIDWPSGMRQSLLAVAADQLLAVVEQDTLYPKITRFDTIPDQYAVTPTTSRLTCDVKDRDDRTNVQVRYLLSGQTSFITGQMTRDSVKTVAEDVFSYWHYDIPALPHGASNLWRIVATSSNGAVDSTANFEYRVDVDTLAPTIELIAGPDSVLADTTGPYIFQVHFQDQAGVSRVDFTLLGQTRTGAPLVVRFDSTLSRGQIVFDWEIEVPGQGLGTVFSYYIYGRDILGSVDTLGPEIVKVKPWRGKASLRSTQVNVADILRLAYIVFGRVPAPSLMDSLGLDLDGNQVFDSQDLALELAIWRQPAASSLLAGLADQSQGAVTAGLIDVGGAVVFYLNNQQSLPYGLIEVGIESDAEMMPLTITPGKRLSSVVHAEGETISGSLLLFFLASEGNKGLAPGNGELFRIWSADPGEGRPVGQLALRLVDFGDVEIIIEGYGRRPGVFLPEAAVLEQNIPNPFNPSTTISFAIPRDDSPGGLLRVKLEIFNLRGARVSTLVDEFLPAGYHRANWNGRDGSGRPLPSGVYFYRLRAGRQVFTRKMILLK